jgi:hypothetical protein
MQMVMLCTVDASVFQGPRKKEGNKPPTCLGYEQFSGSSGGGDDPGGWRGKRHADGYGSPEFDASRRPGVNPVSRSTRGGTPLWGGSSGRVMLMMACNQKASKRRPKR